MYNNFEISLVVVMPNITTNHAITYTNALNRDLELIPQANKDIWKINVAVTKCSPRL